MDEGLHVYKLLQVSEFCSFCRREKIVKDFLIGQGCHHLGTCKVFANQPCDKLEFV